MRLTFEELCEHVFIRFRRKRMKHFFALIAPSSSVRLLDIGGTSQTWEVETECHLTFAVTLLNKLQYEDINRGRFKSVIADATDLPFPDKSFDIAFSNSVIEHMGTWERQLAFAREARRVAHKLWIQTPARSFPIEAHLLAPFVQYLPKSLQHRIVRWTPRGLMTPDDVHAIVDEVRLLTKKEICILFPDCRILRETVWGLTKSYTAVRDR